MAAVAIAFGTQDINPESTPPRPIDHELLKACLGTQAQVAFLVAMWMAVCFGAADFRCVKPK